MQTMFGMCCGGAGADEAGADAPEGEWVLRFSSLSATALNPSDINGKSDPYVVFFGAFLAAPPAGQQGRRGAAARWTTSTVNCDLNPYWKCPEQVPALPLLVASAAVIRREYLFFRIMDEDTLTADDVIGCGRLFLGPLGDAMAAGREGSIDTTLVLTHHGRRAGTLSLEVTLEKRKAK
jgi:hypothetical protein